MLDKQTVIDSVNVRDSGHLEVREAIRILEDGNVISTTFHRYVVEPGAAVPEAVETYLRSKLLPESLE